MKRLFALSGNRCAFRECSTPLVDPETGSIIGEICHIKGEKPTAPRHDAAQNNDARHGFDNLILLCNVHHKVIDDNQGEYSVERLISMKQESEDRQSGKEALDAEISEAMASAFVNSFGDQGEGVQAVHVSGGQVAHTINNYAASLGVVVPIVVAVVAMMLPSIFIIANPGVVVPSKDDFTASPGVVVSSKDDESIVFGQIEVCTSECAWEPVSRPVRLVAPIHNIFGRYWSFGGPPIGLPPQSTWAMGSHQLWPLRKVSENENLDVDPIFEVTLLNRRQVAMIVSRIGMRPLAAWTSPKGPPSTGRIVEFDSYSLAVNGFEPGVDQFLILKEPVRLMPNDPYRLRLRLSGYCGKVPRNETVIQLIVEADQKTIASDEIYLGLYSVPDANSKISDENEP